MYNLLEYIHNYSITSGRLWNYYRDKMNDVDANDSVLDGKSFEYKAKILRETPKFGNPGDADQPV